MNLTDGEVTEALRGTGVVAPSEACEIRALSGGVSCDVFAVRTATRTLCVKRTLPTLGVAAAWRAPAERSEADVAWMRLVAGIDANWVPEILGEDRARHLFVMEFFPPEQYPVWKSLLAEGEVDPAFAARVGDALGRIHAAVFGALKDAYFAKADWEEHSDLESRTAGLLAAFLLARIDGKSPVEYITAERDKAFVRTMAKGFLNGRKTLDEMAAHWTGAPPARQING